MRNRNPIFTMPPSEQTPAPPVEGVIHVDAASYWRSIHKFEELKMRVAELSGKVDALISLATNYKTAADSQPAAQMPQDDPEIEALALRIDDAIAVLQGSKTVTDPTTPRVPAGSAPLGTTGVDPNAPV